MKQISTSHRFPGYPLELLIIAPRSLFGFTVVCIIMILLSARGNNPLAATLQIHHYPVEAVLQAVPLIGNVLPNLLYCSALILADGHNDFPIWIRAFYQNHIYNFTEMSEINGQVDFSRLRKGRLRGQFWSVYVPCPAIENDHSDRVYWEIVHDTLQQIDLVHRLIAAFPRRLHRATCAADVWKNFAESDSVSSLIGAEGLHQIGNSASILRMYHRLGMRYITLTHDCHNVYADSASPPIPLHHGLSDAGIELLREMNRIGMAIDLSHTSAESARMALRLSVAPVLFSHSSSFALCPHRRNVPDDVLLMVKQNGGVVMVTFYPEYINCQNPEDASIVDVADHIEHIGRLIGYRHVGIGSDFDGMLYGPRGLEDVSKYPELIRELIQRGLTRSELKRVVGTNLLRVLKEVELVAAQLINRQPLEDDVRSLFG